MLGDTAIQPLIWLRPWIAAQSIMLCAVRGRAGRVHDRLDPAGDLSKALEIPASTNYCWWLALGKPKESSREERWARMEALKYWRDEQQVHHVPKRELKDIIIG